MKPRTSFLLAVAGIGIGALPARAQTRLIALEQGSRTAVVQRDRARCRVIQRCMPPGFRATSDRHAGGTAYDPRTGGVWISNGTVLAKIDPDTCRYQCSPIAPPITPNSVVTGLAMQESRHLLFIVDSAGALTTVRVRDCSLQVLSRCRISVQLADRQRFSGLAVDERRGLILYSASNFAGDSVSQAIYVARTSDPCNPVCVTRMFNCSAAARRLGAITGLAFDPCASAIIATDGTQTVVADFRMSTDGCVALNHRCCGAADPLSGAIGLCIRPGGSESVGSSCTNRSCQNCPRMTQTLVGDPSIGNPNLRFVLEHAPSRSRAFLVLNRGSCLAPGVLVPGFCGPIRVPLRPLPPIVVGPFLTGGGLAPCDGSAVVELSVPLDLALCGDDFATQFIVLCGPDSTSQFGTGLSNCRQWVITGT